MHKIVSPREQCYEYESCYEVFTRRIPHILTPSWYHNIIWSRGLVPWLWNMPIISCRPPTKKNTLLFIRVTLRYLGGVILPALLAKLIVHPHTIHMKLYSSRYYSLKVLFITALSSEVPHYYS